MGRLGSVRVGWRREEDAYVITLRLDAGEGIHGHGQGGAPMQLVTNEATFRFDGEQPDPHPDLLAVAALSIAVPWVKCRVRFSAAISPGLAEAIAEYFGLAAGPVDPRLDVRRSGSRVALAFGVGADSTAVSLVLPRDAPHIHLRRVSHRRVPNRFKEYRPEVFERLALGFEDLGRHVIIVPSDVEYLRAPHPTYATWPAVGVGAYLLADALDLGSVAFGTVLGPRYLYGGLTFGLPTPKEHPWDHLFARAGLPFMMPLAGSTEVTTGLIVRRAGLSSHVRSCPVGDESGPCWTCMKCFRKELVTAAWDARPLDDRLLRNLHEGHPIVERFRSPPPYPVHHMAEYGLARLIDGPTFLEEAAAPFRDVRDETDWVARYYPRSAEFDVLPQWRSTVGPAIAKEVEMMSTADVSHLEGWDALARVGRLTGSRYRV